MEKEQFEALIAGLEDRGISRTKIASGAGISRDTVWRLATGTARRPSWETIERLRNFEQKCGAARPVGQKTR